MEARRAALRARLAQARGALDQLDAGGDRDVIAASHGMTLRRLLQIIRLLELGRGVLAHIESADGPVPPERILHQLFNMDEAEQMAAVDEWMSEANRTGRWG